MDNRTRIDTAEVALLEYNLALKRLEIWQHLQFILIKQKYLKGSIDERLVWLHKIPVLRALCQYIGDRDSPLQVNEAVNQHELYAKGWFSKTDVFIKDVESLVGKLPHTSQYTCMRKDVAAKDFARIQEKNAVIQLSDERYKEVAYSLANKKVEILFHLGTLNLNIIYDKGNVEEKEVWNQKTAVISALLKFMEDRNIGALNKAINEHPLYDKGWFSKTDVYVKDVMNLISQLPQKRNVMTNTGQNFYPPVPKLTEEERQRKSKEQNKQMDDMLKDAQRLKEGLTIVNTKLNSQRF